MIYENYFQVPDGELCRPVGFKIESFYRKEDWPSVYSDLKNVFELALGKWEAQEPTITITEKEFDKAVLESKKDVSRQPPGSEGPFSYFLKKRLFK